MNGLMISIVIQLAIWAGIIYLIVRAVNRNKTNSVNNPLTLDNFKKWSISIAIAILLPVFINLTVSALFPELKDTSGLATALILSIVCLGVGFMIKNSTIVSFGLTIGSMISLLYAITVRYAFLDSWSKAGIIGFGLILSTFLTYWNETKAPQNGTRTILNYVKGNIGGVLVFIFAVSFIYTFNSAINPEPKSPTYNYSLPTPSDPVVDDYYSSQTNPFTPLPQNTTLEKQAQARIYEQQSSDYQDKLNDYNRNTFIVVMIISIIYLLAGLAVRSVPVVSIAFIVASLLNIIVAVASSFDSFGKGAKAIVSGLAVLILIVVAYWKLEKKPDGQANHPNNQPTSSTPTDTNAQNTSNGNNGQNQEK